MPYINIKISREGVKPEKKVVLIKGTTDLLVDVLGKKPTPIFVVVNEVDLQDFGVGGMPLNE